MENDGSLKRSKASQDLTKLHSDNIEYQKETDASTSTGHAPLDAAKTLKKNPDAAPQTPQAQRDAHLLELARKVSSWREENMPSRLTKKAIEVSKARKSNVDDLPSIISSFEIGSQHVEEITSAYKNVLQDIKDIAGKYNRFLYEVNTYGTDRQNLGQLEETMSNLLDTLQDYEHNYKQYRGVIKHDTDLNFYPGPEVSTALGKYNSSLYSFGELFLEYRSKYHSPGETVSPDDVNSMKREWMTVRQYAKEVQDLEFFDRVADVQGTGKDWDHLNELVQKSNKCIDTIEEFININKIRGTDESLFSKAVEDTKKKIADVITSINHTKDSINKKSRMLDMRFKATNDNISDFESYGRHLKYRYLDKRCKAVINDIKEALNPFDPNTVTTIEVFNTLSRHLSKEDFQQLSHDQFLAKYEELIRAKKIDRPVPTTTELSPEADQLIAKGHSASQKALARTNLETLRDLEVAVQALEKYYKEEMWNFGDEEDDAD